MYKVEMYTIVGYSGCYSDSLQEIIDSVLSNNGWYHAHIINTDDGKVIYKASRPYYVKKLFPDEG